MKDVTMSINELTIADATENPNRVIEAAFNFLGENLNLFNEPEDPSLSIEDIQTEVAMRAVSFLDFADKVGVPFGAYLKNAMDKYASHANAKYFRRMGLLEMPRELDLASEPIRLQDLIDLGKANIDCEATIELWICKIEGRFDRKTSVAELSSRYGVPKHEMYRKHQKFVNAFESDILDILFPNV